jgi:hypothetical protein
VAHRPRTPEQRHDDESDAEDRDKDDSGSSDSDDTPRMKFRRRQSIDFMETPANPTKTDSVKRRLFLPEPLFGRSNPSPIYNKTSSTVKPDYHQLTEAEIAEYQIDSGDDYDVEDEGRQLRSITNLMHGFVDPLTSYPQHANYLRESEYLTGSNLVASPHGKFVSGGIAQMLSSLVLDLSASSSADSVLKSPSSRRKKLLHSPPSVSATKRDDDGDGPKRGIIGVRVTSVHTQDGLNEGLRLISGSLSGTDKEVDRIALCGGAEGKDKRDHVILEAGSRVEVKNPRWIVVVPGLQDGTNFKEEERWMICPRWTVLGPR